MSKQPGVAAPAAELPDPASSSARVVSIDILRGLAILWVMVFHLWGDRTLHLNDTPQLYANFRDRLFDGIWIPALTAFGELIAAHGYLGVPLFMMLSGLSLTMNAYRRGEPSVWKGYVARFRRVVPVYWAGVLLIVAAIGAVALLQVLFDGGTIQDQWSAVRGRGNSPVDVGWDDVLWALTVLPWLFRDKFTTVPVGALWFVQLLLQYYLIFPFAFALLKKIGPWYFALAGLALTIALRAAYIPWWHASIQYYHGARYFADLAPFRAWEFFIGMSFGYLFVHRREQLRSWVGSPLDAAGLVAIGAGLVASGVIIAPQGDNQLTASDLMIQAGLALVILPLLVKPPARLEASAPARALVFLGVVSFPALIVNEMMRYFGVFLIHEGMEGPPRWFFFWVVYVPVGTLLAYPLAKVFGLLPEQRARNRADVPAPAANRATRTGPTKTVKNRRPVAGRARS